MTDQRANFAVTAVTVAPSPADSGTTLEVAHPGRLPDPASGQYNLVVRPETEQPTPDNAEIVRVTAIAGDQLTVVRGQEGTTPRSILVGDHVALAVTAKTVDDLEALVPAHEAEADPHSDYLLDKVSGGAASEVPEHTHVLAAQGGHYAHGETYVGSLLTQRFYLINHRGDMNPTDGFPEGTLEAYLMAAQKGVPVHDIDCRLSGDGTWYLLHDSTLTRTTNGTGSISSVADSYIDALVVDGGYGYDAGRHAALNLRVPTLQSVLDALEPYGCLAQFDLKVAADAGLLAAFVAANGWSRRCFIGVSTQAAAQAVKAVDPSIAVAGDAAWPESDLTGAAWSDVDPGDAEAAAPLPFGAFIPIEDFGVEDDGDIVRDMFALGVRSVTVNDIDAALRAWKDLTAGDVTSHEGAADPHAGYALANHRFVIVGAADSRLTNDRRLTAGAGISITDGGANGTVTVALATGSGARYRQFVVEVSGGGFTFITDDTGNPVMALEELE